MKPAWDQLMEEWADSHAVVTDVDCTGAGKDLCQARGVGGYPTIMWGGGEVELQDYSGGRDYDDLAAFAKENLKPLKPTAEKTPIDLAIKKLKVMLKVLKPLRVDLEHIVNFRKNAAAALLVSGIIIGMILSKLLGALCGKSAHKPEKSKAA